MADAIGSFDYVIVGAGTAGCVLANRLSADPKVTVLLLEAGGKDDWIWIHIPIGYLYTQNNPRTDWCFRTEPEAGLNGRALAYPRGRVLGGCSSINGMIYMRGQARDYDGWRQQGNRGWGWDDTGKLASLMGAIKIAHRGPQNHSTARDEIFARFKRAFGHSPPGA